MWAYVMALFLTSVEIMPAALLDNRALISVSGPEAEHFLQNILTIDLGSIGEHDLRAGALLTPQGKILFDFLVSRIADGFRFDCRADVADDFMRRLTMYRLRAKAEISKQDEALVSVSWGDDSSSSESDSSDNLSVRDQRFKGELVTRTYGGSTPATNDLAGWTSLRIAHGIAESGLDYQLNDAFPHDVLLDQNEGVGFRKGCYVGQEVVSRMQHRGTARRRMLIASGNQALPESFSPVTVNGRNIGALGSVANKSALALVRIDKVKDAMDAGDKIMAGEAELTLRIPDWARFTFPETASEPDAETPA